MLPVSKSEQNTLQWWFASYHMWRWLSACIGWQFSSSDAQVPPCKKRSTTKQDAALCCTAWIFCNDLWSTLLIFYGANKKRRQLFWGESVFIYRFHDWQLFHARLRVLPQPLLSHIHTQPAVPQSFPEKLFEAPRSPPKVLNKYVSNKPAFRLAAPF